MDAMLEIEHNGYYPLTTDSIERHVPSRPGIYILAIQLPNGVRQTLFTNQSENLYRSLRKLVDEEMLALPAWIRENALRCHCFFTYYVIRRPALREEIGKMLSQTSDPVLRLRMVSEN